MRVLHCNAFDAGGGAASAAQRLHAGLLADGVDSTLGVFRRTNHDTRTIQLSNSWRRMLDPLVQKAENILIHSCERQHAALFSPALFPSLVHRRINVFGADVLHLHWITSSFIPLYSLARLKKPVVWTLHDTWGYTGGCHILQGCESYKNKCENCRQLPSNRSFLARFSQSAKKRAVSKIQPVIVAPSRAFMQRISKSTILGDCQCCHIPNCLDTTLFAPCERRTARSLLGLPQDVTIIAFGAISAVSDPNKGYDILARALRELSQGQFGPLHLVVFGTSHVTEQDFPFPVHCLGQLYDSVSLRLAYSSADVFVCPSREENLPNTVMESLACGTPVAAFSVGGIPDMIEHGINGLLATPHDFRELAQCIADILSNAPRRVQMGEAGRRTVEENYSLSIVASQYRHLYESILTVVPSEKHDELGGTL